MSDQKHSVPASNDPRFTVAKGTFWDNAWKYAGIVGVLGALLSTVGAFSDPRHFAFSWLFAFTVFFTVGMGALFFVILQHLTVASWSVSVRRIAEFFAAGVPILALLFVPVVFFRDHLYGEWMNPGADHGESHEAEDAEGHSVNTHGPVNTRDPLLSATVAKAQDHDAPHADAPGNAAPGNTAHGVAAHGDAKRHGKKDQNPAWAKVMSGAHSSPEHTLHRSLLSHKQAYLNTGSWIVRAITYFAAWVLLALFYFRGSTRQDKSQDPKETVSMQNFAPVAMILFSMTLTFAAFDWIMALDAAWYSTIFGVCVFAGAAVTIHSLLIVMSLALRGQGLLGDAVNSNHFHDLGKLAFGFMVFWAYVSFSQMMLVWYAGIPEEAVYYHLRWGEHSWTAVSVILMVGHFVFPFLFLLSRDVKRKYAAIGFGAGWMLLMHVVDIYWYVMPHFAEEQLVVSSLDLTCLLAVGGLYLAAVFYLMRNFPLVPVGDPRLSRALHHDVA